MATKSLLADLVQTYRLFTGISVHIDSVGGVDAAKRVQSGESFDLVLLASDAIDRLMVSGHLQSNSRQDWVCSPVAAAVRAGAPHPELTDEAALKAAVLASPTLSYSTGPSGAYLEQLFARWGVAEALKSRLVVPPPGTPVASLVASGQAALGFQQLSELIGFAGIDVLGTLPDDVAFITTFSSGIPLAIADDAHQSTAVKAFLDYLASADAEDLKRKHGMYWN
ncbi:MAG: ABC transporter substrate-binding protein [Betaproteobacteria bacterium]|nr:ABC transporter substrate-binding protein [Betaproteobacteria bacterium]